MIEEAITKVVADHYRDEGAPILLLSGLGKRLKDEALWPVSDEHRTLLEVVEQAAGLAVIRDEKTPSYIAITLKDEEQRATAAIAERHKRRFLNGLARPVLLAFTIQVREDETVALSLQPKITFIVGLAAPEGATPVDKDLRLPGLDVSDLAEASTADIERLELNIRTWCERRAVDAGALAKAKTRSARLIAPIAKPSSAVQATSSALERLYAAQPADVAGRLAIPMDIALLLSRMP